MSRGAVKVFLALYFAVYFGAVLFRVDYFPLTWVPMYGLRGSGPVLTVPVGDLAVSARGFRVTRRNGEVEFLSRHDLNIPPANFRRLYYERAYGLAPPQHLRERAALHPMNRWWYDTLVGPDPLKTLDYPRQLLTSFNRTEGRVPGDPDYVVRVDAVSDFASFSKPDLARGDLSHPAWEKRLATITTSGGTVRRVSRDAS